jgi:hypothetical protein
MQNQQTRMFTGVKQHNRNGIAEQNVCTICDRACTMLFHAMLKWMTTITVDLGPFALQMAVNIFSRQKEHEDCLVDFHTFGCPALVLEPRLQEGLKIPKWQPRST